MLDNHLDDEQRPATVTEAFMQVSKSLQLFGIERVRIEGLCVPELGEDSYNHSNTGNAAVRTITEHQFMQEFVFHSRPCVIVGALEDWPAMHRWRDDRYLFNLDGHLPMETKVESQSEEEEEKEREEVTGITAASTPEDTVEGQKGVNKEEVNKKEENNGCLREKRVGVALTPNGRADAVTYVTYDASSSTDVDQVKEIQTVTEKLFMCASEVQTTLPELYELLRANPPCPPPKSLYVNLQSNSNPVVAYAQIQNNCFATEYQHLHEDICTDLDRFGERVFGAPREAVNMWMGTPASVSSMHQDWVENLYAVVRGVKEFVLVPPWEGVFVPKPELPSATFAAHGQRGDYAFAKAPARDGLTVPWMDVEIPAAAADDAALLPEGLRDKLHPLVAYVHPGEVLYLPAMWLHRVAQQADRVDRLGEETAEGRAPLPLIAAVNYWYDMSFTNPAVLMLHKFGLLL